MVPKVLINLKKMEQNRMTISEYVEMRVAFASSLTSRLEKIDSTDPIFHYVCEFIDWTKRRFENLSSYNGIWWGFYWQLRSFYFHSETTSFANYNNIILTGEKLYLIGHVCQIIETLIRDTWDKKRADDTKSLKTFFKDYFSVDFCKLKDQFLKEAREIQTYINHPDMDKYTLSMISSCLLRCRHVYIDYTVLDVDAKNSKQIYEELSNLECEVKNQIKIVESAETQSQTVDKEEDLTCLKSHCQVKRKSDSLEEGPSSKQSKKQQPQESSMYLRSHRQVKRKSDSLEEGSSKKSKS